ncbi:MAG: hypothetical protein AB7I37_12090 [Pirellulales bacterium]
MDKDNLRVRLKSRPGYKYDQSEYLIQQATYLFSIVLGDEAVFRNLLPVTWIFENGERPRTLEALVRRMHQRYCTWSAVATTSPVQNSAWYQRIQAIQDDFKWDRMGPLFLTPVKGSKKNGAAEGVELEGSPTASFSIINGVHCALAAMTLLEGGTPFQPFEAILVLPRVDY